MITKLTIENGKTKIILTPENIFEKDILENCHDGKDKYNISTNIEAEYKMCSYEDHKMIVDISEII